MEDLNKAEDIKSRNEKENLNSLNETRKPLNPIHNNENTTVENEENLIFYLKSILGYTIYQNGNLIVLRSVYSFCKEDIFEIEIQGNKLILKNTEYLQEWGEEFKTYVVQGKSYSAFFAAVTLNLFNRNTFG